MSWREIPHPLWRRAVARLTGRRLPVVIDLTRLPGIASPETVAAYLIADGFEPGEIIEVSLDPPHEKAT